MARAAVEVMRDEHDDHARHLRDPGHLANDHTPPEHASPEWRVLYADTRKPCLVGDDAGLVINPDGARNQLEGGIIHAASMTLNEPVTLDGDGIASLDWNRYPIPRFSEVPAIDTVIIPNPDQPKLGMGECTFGSTAAAIGNALYHALGVRVRDMPLTRERIATALVR